MIIGVQNFPKLIKLREILSGFHAKELCTCYFVLEQSEEFCQDYVKQIFEIDAYQIQETRRMVTATLFGYQSGAKLRSKQLGCY